MNRSIYAKLILYDAHLSVYERLCHQIWLLRRPTNSCAILYCWIYFCFLYKINGKTTMTTMFSYLMWIFSLFEPIEKTTEKKRKKKPTNNIKFIFEFDYFCAIAHVWVYVGRHGIQAQCLHCIHSSLSHINKKKIYDIVSLVVITFVILKLIYRSNKILMTMINRCMIDFHRVRSVLSTWLRAKAKSKKF